MSVICFVLNSNPVLELGCEFPVSAQVFHIDGNNIRGELKRAPTINAEEKLTRSWEYRFTFNACEPCKIAVTHFRRLKNFQNPRLARVVFDKNK